MQAGGPVCDRWSVCRDGPRLGRRAHPSPAPHPSGFGSSKQATPPEPRPPGQCNGSKSAGRAEGALVSRPRPVGSACLQDLGPCSPLLGLLAPARHPGLASPRHFCFPGGLAHRDRQPSPHHWEWPLETRGTTWCLAAVIRTRLQAFSLFCVTESETRLFMSFAHCFPVRVCYGLSWVPEIHSRSPGPQHLRM